jgi:predicted DCC family thiol-disulfide oxidoreductase YuxK
MSDQRKQGLVEKWRAIAKLYGKPEPMRDATYELCADELAERIRQLRSKIEVMPFIAGQNNGQEFVHRDAVLAAIEEIL